MKTKEQVAKELADYHRVVDDGIVLIARYTAPDEPDHEPIRLLEVNTATPPAGVVPVHFGPTKDVPFDVVIIELTPQEYQGMLRKELALPPGWVNPVVLYENAVTP